LDTRKIQNFLFREEKLIRSDPEGITSRRLGVLKGWNMGGEGCVEKVKIRKNRRNSTYGEEECSDIKAKS